MADSNVREGAPVEPAPGPVVLVVDDAEPLLAPVCAMLQRRGCAHVDARSDARTVLADCRARAYDVVVLDVELGVTDGVSVARSLRAHGHRMPIVFWTGRPDRVAAVLDELAPASVLGKPTALDALVAAVAAAHSKSRTP